MQTPSSSTQRALLDEHRDELLDEERVAGRGAREPCAYRGLRAAEQALEQRVDLDLAERLEPHRDVPVGTVLESSGRARQSDRTGASAIAAGRPASRSSSAGSAQWMSSTTTTSGRVTARRGEEVADRPGRLLRAS